MTTTSPVAGSTPASKNLIARFIGIITSPKETYQSVAASPKWFGMMALTAVLVGFFTALPMTTEAGKQATLDQQVQAMQAWGVQVNDQMYERMQQGMSRAPYTTAATVILVTPIFAVILCGILFAIFNAALGGEASFKQVLAIYTHSGVVSSLSAVISGIVNYFRGGVGSVTNVGALLPMLPENSFGANLLGTVDIFIIWWLVVLAMGLGVLYKRRTQPIAISLLAVYAVIGIGIAIVKSSRGGA